MKKLLTVLAILFTMASFGQSGASATLHAPGTDSSAIRFLIDSLKRDSTLQQAFDKSVLAGNSPIIDANGNVFDISNASGFVINSASGLNSALLQSAGNGYTRISGYSDSARAEFESNVDDEANTHVWISASHTTPSNESITHTLTVHPLNVVIDASIDGNPTHPKFIINGADTLLTPPTYIWAADGDTLKKYPYTPGGGGTLDSTRISKVVADTTKAAKTFLSDITLKGPLLQENVHTVVSPNNVNAVNAAGHLTLPTYEGSGQNVHPDVWYTPNGWNGHKWWLGMTPYPFTRDRFENPSLLYSDDGVTWSVPTGVTNPISPEPTDTVNVHQSDVDLIAPGFYDDKLRVLYSRSTLGVDTFFTRTYDGAVVGPEVFAYAGGGTEQPLSPCITERNGVFTMYYVESSVSPNVVYRLTATSPEGPWTNKTLCTIVNTTGLDVWHINTNLFGDEVHMWITTATLNTSGTASKLYFASSADGLTFTMGTNPVLSASASGWDNLQIYRASAIVLDGGTKRYGLFYTGRSTVPTQWYTGYTEVNMVVNGTALNGTGIVSMAGTTPSYLSSTGTGNVALATTPVFTTNITSPLVLGGTGTTQTLTFQTSSGSATTGSDMIFKDNNTEWMRILNNGRVGVGTSTPGAILEARDNTALTNAAQNVLVLNHRTSGTATTAFGVGFAYKLQSSTTFDNIAAQTIVEWADATHASRRPTKNDYLTNASGSSIAISTSTLQSDQSSIFTTFLGNLGIGATATSTDKLEVTGNLSLKSAGNKLKIATGTNSSINVSGAMTAGTITISTTAVTAASKIFLTHATIGGTPGILYVGTITAGTSFVINSTSNTDTGTVNWWIIN